MTITQICSIEGCRKPCKARGYCRGHYARLLRHGDPLAGGLPKGAAQNALQDAINHSGDECFIWPFGKTAAGYPVVMLKSKLTYVHIHVCEAMHGPKPEGHYEAAHKCGNPNCCAPKHLRWATPHENALDKRAHGTMPRGQGHHWARLTDAQVDEIMELKGEASTVEVGKRFGVTQSTISAYWLGKLRAHQTGHH